MLKVYLSKTMCGAFNFDRATKIIVPLLSVQFNI